MRLQTNRRKVIHCGKYGIKNEFIEIDVYPHDPARKQTNRKRKQQITAPSRQNLNDKNARRYFGQLVKSNFTENDIHLTLTYQKKHRPDNIEQAEKEVTNFLRRLKRKYQKAQAKFFYIFVTEFGTKGKVHHHVLLPSGIPREDIESTWTKKEKGKPAEAIGYANTRRIQLINGTMEQLVSYLQKEAAGKKRWKSSNGLIRPWATIKDAAYTKRKLDKLAQLPQDCEDVKRFWEKEFPDYICYESVSRYNAETGRWSMYAKMRRRRQ